MQQAQLKETGILPLFSAQHLYWTPSRYHEISKLHEDEMRALGCQFLFRLGASLSVNEVVIGRACYLFHHFFAHQSFGVHNRKEVAAASLFLAAKLEEVDYHSVDTIIRHFNQVINQTRAESLQREGRPIPAFPANDPSSKEWGRVRCSIYQKEGLLLDMIQFRLDFMNPLRRVAPILCQMLVDCANFTSQQSRQFFNSKQYVRHMHQIFDTVRDWLVTPITFRSIF